MLKNDIDEIYELCKRVITEQPEVYCLFDFSPGTMGVLLYKDRKKLDTKSGPPDFNITIFCDGLTVRPSGKDAYEKTRKTLLELLENKEQNND